MTQKWEICHVRQPWSNFDDGRVFFIHPDTSNNRVFISLQSFLDEFSNNVSVENGAFITITSMLLSMDWEPLNVQPVFPKGGYSNAEAETGVMSMTFKRRVS